MITVKPGIYAHSDRWGLASGGRSADQWKPEAEEKLSLAVSHPGLTLITLFNGFY